MKIVLKTGSYFFAAYFCVSTYFTFGPISLLGLVPLYSSYVFYIEKEIKDE